DGGRVGGGAQNDGHAAGPIERILQVGEVGLHATLLVQAGVVDVGYYADHGAPDGTRRSALRNGGDGNVLLERVPAGPDGGGESAVHNGHRRGGGVVDGRKEATRNERRLHCFEVAGRDEALVGFQIAVRRS